MESDADNRVRRILLLGRGGPLDGSQRQLWYLVRGLDQNRFAPIVVLDRPGPLADLLRRTGVEVHIIPLRAWRDLRDQSRALR